MELIFRAMKGDHEAFGSLVEMYRGEVFGIALSIVGDPTDADDLTQEVFIKAYQSLNKLTHPERFVAWLHSITRNHCKDWLRTQKQQYLPFDELLGSDQLELPYINQTPIDDDSNLDFLSLLKDEDGKLLKLFYIQGFSYDEIMRVNGISYSAVTSRMHKAKGKVRSLVNKNGISTESLLSTLSGEMEYMRLNLGLSSEILNRIKAVEYAQNIEAEKKSHFLCGTNLEYTKESGLRLITTDGKRMAVAQLPRRNGNGDMSIIIPTDELSILKEYLAGKNADVSIEKIDDNMAAFYIGDSKKLIKLIPDKYPDYRAVIFYPMGYDKSITIDRKLAISFMEKIIETSEGYDPSDWVQWDDTIYVTKASDLLNTKEITKRSMETFRQILHFIVKDNPSVVEYADELANNIFKYLPQEEYQKQLDEIEKRKLPPAKPIGTLKVLESQGEVKFVGRFNSHFILDALKTMESDNVRIFYKIEELSVIMHPILLKDNTENIHIIMPMKVD